MPDQPAARHRVCERIIAMGLEILFKYLTFTESQKWHQEVLHLISSDLSLLAMESVIIFFLIFMHLTLLIYKMEMTVPILPTSKIS